MTEEEDKSRTSSIKPLPEIKMGRSALPPGMLEKARRAEWGLPEEELQRGDYMAELNLLYHEGIAAAAERFEHLYQEATGSSGSSLRIAKTYYRCELTIGELQSLIGLDEQKSELRDRCIYKIWPDFPVQMLIDRSVATVKGDAALSSFDASGRDITWAVIDSGIEGNHPHFGPEINLEDKSDEMKEKRSRHLLFNDGVSALHRNFLLEDPDLKQPKRSKKQRKALLLAHQATALSDNCGHGTLVAGILAGGLKGQEKEVDCRIFERRFESDPSGGEKMTMQDTVGERKRRGDDLGKVHGVAPDCRLISLKVLNEKGIGRSSDVIRALTYIRENLNDDPKILRVQGVNLSIGYEFDPEMFACGQSPLCVEVDRLVQAGVVVVAAGNTGYGTALSQERNTRIGLANTINDPGNAAMAITVGATHRDAPHTYGISYFSSKGPTGDGRLKPDLVAPGERITSCVAGQMLEDIKKKVKLTALAPLESGAAGPELPLAAYLDANGTSMAAPHVSGAIAAFLSIRREFIGKPQEVKRIFLASATSLGRERYFEGHGLVDLMRAIQSV
jgi:subtilisin family serine protease